MLFYFSLMKTKAEAATMEGSASPPMDPVPVEQPAVEPQVQQPDPPIPIPKPELVLDPTDLSDTTESEAEKHGCKYFLIYFALKFIYFIRTFF